MQFQAKYLADPVGSHEAKIKSNPDDVSHPKATNYSEIYAKVNLPIRKIWQTYRAMYKFHF
jgi:hypothetical protein